MTKVVLRDIDGCTIGELPVDAEQLIFDAEASAKKSLKTKRQSLADTFLDSIQHVGYEVMELGFEQSM